MANGNRSIVVGRLSGSIGDELTFKNTASGSVVSKKIKAYQQPYTDSQKDVQRQFKRAVAYAKHAIGDPQLNPVYQAAARRGRSAYNVAYMDAYTPPVIDRLSYAKYSGDLGSTLGIDITNVVSTLASVKVVISKADGTVVESGDAVSYRSGWLYTATAVNDAVPGSLISVTATDLAENEETSVFELA